jgi:signal transduction histidine kinase
MSVRLRLTLLYSVILALTLLAFSTVVYVTVRWSTYETLKGSLRADAERVVGIRKWVSLHEFQLPTEQFATKNTFFQVRGLDGRVVNRTANLYDRDIPMGDKARSAALYGASGPEFVQAPDGDGRWLVYNRDITVNNVRVGLLQAARSLEDQDETLGALRKFLAVGGVLATALAFLVGWMLSGAALRPINRMTQTARAIGAEQDFGRRVRHSGPNDEVGRLASTFNTMLAQLGGAYGRLEHALQAQRRFVADASHELRTPLTSIRGNVALLERTPPISPEDRRAVLDDVRDESDRLIRLVNDLLALARADAGRPMRSEAAPLRPLVEELCRQSRALAPGRELVCDDVTDHAAQGDRDAIKQVLLILLDNALKFTPPGGMVSVQARASGDRVELTVSDTGPGISDEALPHIFERFYRADAARSGGGAGLGLAIARTLVEAQKGGLSVRSEPGRGSAFTVSLPRAADPAGAERAAASGAVPG